MPLTKLLCLLLCLLFLFGCAPQQTKPIETPVPTLAPQRQEVVFVLPTPSPTPTPLGTALPTPTPSPTPTPTSAPYTGPMLRLYEGETLVLPATFYFTDPGCYATDREGHDITDRVKVKGKVIPYIPGEYSLSYSVTDSEGLTTTATRLVLVEAVPLPETVEPADKTVYLTFDDGPCDYTEKLLDILKKYDVKVTFFVVGNKRRADLIKRAFEEGHTIGVHTYCHEYKTIYADENAFFEDFLATQEVIYQQTGTYAQIFRFPGGSGNTASRVNKGIMSRLTVYMENMGYRYFDWNVASGDTGSNHTTAAVKGSVLNGLKKQPWSIVLQHDIRSHSVNAVESIIKWGLANGYSFEPLTMTSPVMHSKVQN